MPVFRVAYLDMNSFFASVESHLDPALRGRPLAITAVDSESGSCVAASYEAKAFGVKTGTRVAEARRLCPGIIFRPSRHKVYVRFNLAIADILDRFAQVTHIRSVDEFQLSIPAHEQDLDRAVALVKIMKKAVADEIGPSLRISAGLGPNHLLAKIAGKLEKPDGLQWLSQSNMPDRIAHLDLNDLPGISTAMKTRLLKAGVYDVASLCRLDPRHARQIWRSVEGERFVRLLQGMDIPLTPTKRSGYGNSKVLAPQYRDPRQAYYVGRWLTEKAAARLRRDHRTSARFSLSLGFIDGASWTRAVSCFPSQDSAYFLRLHRSLWKLAAKEIRLGRVISISVNFADVALLNDRLGDLLAALGPAEKTKGEVISTTVDQINSRFGQGAIRYGLHAAHPGFFDRS